ncbi:hypothetical protein [Shewanella vesiculosa]|uniref:hypothetical protein n=1 Tax=Shewanella vesiculosa TaxID=518738 RepID=UPI00384D1D46
MKDVNVVFWCTIIALILIIIWNGYYVVIRNPNAKDVVFSYTTLLAAMIFYILNIYFTLNKEESVKQISSHLSHRDDVIDVYKNGNDSFKSFFIISSREDISKIVNIPTSKDVIGYGFEEMRAHVNKVVDYMKINFIGSIATGFYDWESEPMNRMKGCWGYSVSNDTNKNHEFFSHDKFICDVGLNIDSELLQRTNISEWVKLPKNTRVYGTKNSVCFDNPHFLVKVEFYVDINVGWDVQYKANGEMYSFSSNVREPSERVITYFSTIKYTEIFKGELSGNTKKAIYKAWSNRLFNYISDNFALT